MHVLFAPDCFSGTLTAQQAGDAMAAGWAKHAPDDVRDVCPMSDGGTGFVDALAAGLGGELSAVTVTGPQGEAVPAAVLLVESDEGLTAYVESAQACGLHLVPEHARDPLTTTSYGVGELIAHAVEVGARRIVVGLGGSATNDAGVGMLAALGAHTSDDVALDMGGGVLADLAELDLTMPRSTLAGVELVAASDVDNPLLGLTGATNSFARQKGADDDAVMRLEAALEAVVAAIGRTDDGRNPAVAMGSGAAGGMGYGLLCLGAHRVPGIGTVADALNLTERMNHADLVVTGEGCFDWTSLRGKVVTGVAQAATAAARPCVVAAGTVLVGRRDYAAIGVTGAYSMADIVGSTDIAMNDPWNSLATTAQRIARTWSPAAGSP